MPYFQRKPIDGLIDIVGSRAPIPGLPSRGPAPSTGVAANTQPVSPSAAITGIVEQAGAALTSGRPSRTAGSSAGSGAGSLASAQGMQIRQLQERASELIEQFFAVAGGRWSLETAAPPSTFFTGQVPLSDAADLIVEPAPALSPPGPIAPGGTAQISISLVNDDQRPAHVAFFSTDLIGQDGAHIPAEGVSFEPRELELPSGKTGEVMVRVDVPAHTRCGVYSGLIRASTLDYLHAVLVVQVERP